MSSRGLNYKIQFKDYDAGNIQARVTIKQSFFYQFDLKITCTAKY